MVRMRGSGGGSRRRRRLRRRDRVTGRRPTSFPMAMWFQPMIHWGFGFRLSSVLSLGCIGGGKGRGRQ
jgi:hypothetical protein